MLYCSCTRCARLRLARRRCRAHACLPARLTSLRHVHMWALPRNLAERYHDTVRVQTCSHDCSSVFLPYRIRFRIRFALCTIVMERGSPAFGGAVKWHRSAAAMQSTIRWVSQWGSPTTIRHHRTRGRRSVRWRRRSDYRSVGTGGEGRWVRRGELPEKVLDRPINLIGSL